MRVIEVKTGDEVIQTIEHKLSQLNIKNGAIVSFFGAFDSCCISNMPKDDAKQDILVDYDIPLEVSGCGDIVDGKAHIHVTASSVDERVVAGHLHWAKVNTWFIKAYVISTDL